MKSHSCIGALGAALVCAALGSGTGHATATAVGAPQTYSADSLYNQGNAEARAGRPAAAVLNYERARLLDPLDADIRSNLRTTRQRAGLPAQEDGFTQHFRLAAPNTMYWWGVFGLLFIGSGLIARRLLPTRRGHAAVLATAGLVMVGVSGCDALATRSLLHESVVMKPAAARASPVSSTDPLFTLAAAQVVRVRDQHQDFVLVSDVQGRQGWVARDDLAPIIPGDSTGLVTPS